LKKKLIKSAEPYIGSEEIQEAVKVLESGNFVSGRKVEEFENAFADYIGVDYAVAVNSGTSALHLALLSLGIGKGDEVIVPALTFFATVEAVLYVGATPVFADIDEEIFCMLPEDVSGKLTEKTRAVIPVHLFGHPCDIEKLNDVVSEFEMENHLNYTIPFIEDCAQAHGAEYLWGKLPTALYGCFSFYAAKNMTVATEGGIIVTDDSQFAEKCRILRNHGMTDRNTHAYLGYNYRMNEIAAAIGLVQLKHLDRMNMIRQKIADYYNRHIDVEWLQKPVVKDYCTKHAWFWYSCLIDEDELGMPTQTLREKLLSEGIETRFRYTEPLYHQPVIRKYFSRHPYQIDWGCPVAEDICGRIIGLPMHPKLSEEDLEYICEVLNSI